MSETTLGSGEKLTNQKLTNNSSAEAITEAAALDVAGAVRAGEISARAVVDAHLAHIEAVDTKVGAYLLVDAEGARAKAAAVDEKVAAGTDPGALAGVPVGLKDIFCTKGIETTCASKILKGFVPPYESTVSDRLAQAGTISLGKVNMDEFAMGSSNENSAFGPVRNPWDVERVPGGSSGGSAAAVAARLATVALGTDTGGSIRQPASFCGVVGLKPTYGRVSWYGVIAFASSLDHPGPMGRTVADVAGVTQVIAGQDPHDATSLPSPVGDYLGATKAGVAGMRLGIPKQYFGEGLDPEVEKAVQDAVRVGGQGRQGCARVVAAHRICHRDLLLDLHGRGRVEPGPV